MYYIQATNLKEAKELARRENKNNNRLNQMSVSSGKLYKKHLLFNEYVFESNILN